MVLSRSLAKEQPCVGWVPRAWVEGRKRLSRHRKQLELRVRQEVLVVRQAEVCSGLFNPQNCSHWKHAAALSKV